MKFTKIILTLCLFLLVGCSAPVMSQEPLSVTNNTGDGKVSTSEKGDKQDEQVVMTKWDDIVLKEEDFKAQCGELVFKEITEESVGKYVTKELVFDYGDSSEMGLERYKCGALEDFVEDIGGYQKTYRVYRIIDCRSKKDFPIQGNDVLRVYGIIESVSKSYHTGDYNPTIKMYYADYIKGYGQKPEEVKSEEVVIREREEAVKELEYKDSLNSDYTGVTKNISNMDALPIDEYVVYCDAMNLQDVVNSNEDFTGRHIKLHVQLSSHYRFKNDDAKKKRLFEYADSAQNDFWQCLLLNERVDKYVFPKAKIDTVYFTTEERNDISQLRKGDNLIVYGQFVKHDSKSGQFEMLVRCYEKE